MPRGEHPFDGERSLISTRTRTYTVKIWMYEGFYGHLTRKRYTQAKIASENVCHNNTINIHHTGGCKGPFSSRAREIHGHVTEYIWFLESV